jgi:hypothetical protein
VTILTQEEKRFLDVVLHESTTAPFTGPATEALHKIGVEYGDLSYIAWAYNREAPRTGFEWGNSAETVAPLPWTTRESAHQRNRDIQRVWEQERKGEGSPRAAGVKP